MSVFALNKVICMLVRLRLLVGFLIVSTIFVPSLAQDASDLTLTIVSEAVVDDGSRAVMVQFIVEGKSVV